ncbi:MAG: cbb3-type cytochrome oxidase assembly protein CcoS [Hyphomicrobiales bacterium]|jgi:cbb3-type cytochrome oxidase maturation protein|nr:cbb3-type cytochrome oxidase assembly protein CcoS [Hyphomicrobiales bacterium]NBS02101.1 cbb3-type cytochrome oxidase assembly protein CcoS [Hyphomicrobiales bacterium]
MSVLLYLVPTALGLGLVGLFGFMWSMRSGQYDDMEGAANRILNDDDLPDQTIRPAANDLKGP